MFHEYPQKSGQLVEHRSIISFSQLSYLGEPLRAAAYNWAAVHCTTRRAIIHIYSMDLGCVMALCLVTFTSISSPFSLEGKKSWSIWVYVFFSFFLPKVYFQCQLLPPKLSLQFQCTDGLRMRVFVRVHLCVYFREGCLFLVPDSGFSDAMCVRANTVLSQV